MNTTNSGDDTTNSDINTTNTSVSKINILTGHRRSLSKNDIEKLLVIFKFVEGDISTDGLGYVVVKSNDITRETFDKYTDNKELILTADLISSKTGKFTVQDQQKINMPYQEHILEKASVFIKTQGYRGVSNYFGCCHGSDITTPELDKDGLLSLNLFHCSVNVYRNGWSWLGYKKYADVEYKNVLVRVSPIFVSLYKLFSE